MVVVAAAAAGLLAYLLIAAAFRIGVATGIVITLGVAFGLLGLYLVVGRTVETLYQRGLILQARSEKHVRTKPSARRAPRSR